MNKEFEELKEYTEKMLSYFPISMLEDEKIFLEQIDKLFEANSMVEINDARKFIEIVENYLKMKKNMLIRQEDFKFLKELSDELRKQETRKGDRSNPILFKITNSIGEDMLYLTRKAVKQYCEINTGATMEIIDTNSFEIAKLLDILKRNF